MLLVRPTDWIAILIKLTQRPDWLPPDFHGRQAGHCSKEGTHGMGDFWSGSMESRMRPTVRHGQAAFAPIGSVSGCGVEISG